MVALFTVAFTIVVVVLLMTFATAQQIPTVPCLDADARERTRALLLEGVDTALKQHTVGVFDSWLRDPSEQPTRAIRGMRAGISAYARSRAAALNWSPPLCTPKVEVPQ